MRHLRMVGLCLVAVFAIAAVAATSASALPEFGQCYVQAKHEGKYANAGCTVKAKKVSEKFTGEFEWRKATEVEPAKRKFSGTGGAGVLATELKTCENTEKQHFSRRTPGCPEGFHEVTEEAVGKVLKVECTSETNHGEEKGTKEVANVSVTFKGCTIFGSVPCSNSAQPEEIKVNLLKGKLGFINKNVKPREVGILLQPIVKNGPFTSFTCGEGGQLTTVVGVGNEQEGAWYKPEKTGGYDGIISPMTPVNTMTNEFQQVYTFNEKLENIPSHFEGQHIYLLEDYLYKTEFPSESSKWSPAGEAVTNTSIPVETAEIKAN
jgi:hypothetical protein